MLNFLLTDIELRKFMDKEHPLFIDFPESTDKAAELWANAIYQGAKDVIPISLTAENAKTESENVMKQMFKVDGKAGLVLGFQTFAATLALGMQPTYTGTPPAAPLLFDPVFIIGLAGGSNSDCINGMIAIINLWFALGIAVNNGTGVTQKWM
jgi:hypothetical protein